MITVKKNRTKEITSRKHQLHIKSLCVLEALTRGHYQTHEIRPLLQKSANIKNLHDAAIFKLPHV